MTENKKKYGIFIDIDGTLLGKNTDALRENIDTIQRVRALGHKVFVSTGRSSAYLPVELEADKNFDGVITGAGALLNMGGKQLFKTLMPYEYTEKFCRFVLDNNLPGVLEGEKNLYYFGVIDNPWDGWIKVGENIYDMLKNEDIPIEKFTIMGEFPTEIDEILAEGCYVLRFPTYGEIIRKDCGKGQALRKTMKLLGLPLSQSIAIGDSINDSDMLEAAGISVAMGNGNEVIKKTADIITDTVDNAGVSKALKRIFNI